MSPSGIMVINIFAFETHLHKFELAPDDNKYQFNDDSDFQISKR